MRSPFLELSNYFFFLKSGLTKKNLCIFNKSFWVYAKTFFFILFINAKLSTCKITKIQQKVIYTRSYTHYPQVFYVNQVELLW